MQSMTVYFAPDGPFIYVQYVQTIIALNLNVLLVFAPIDEMSLFGAMSYLSVRKLVDVWLGSHKLSVFKLKKQHMI